jgi:hypothetical protein
MNKSVCKKRVVVQNKSNLSPKILCLFYKNITTKYIFHKSEIIYKSYKKSSEHHLAWLGLEDYKVKPN